MTTHIRQQALDRLSGTTLLNLTTTQARVYVGRTTPLDAAASASLLIDLGGESAQAAEILHGRNRVLERNFEVLVRAAVKAASGYIATLNTIALEVETAIGGDQTLGGIAKWVQLTQIDEPELDGSGEKTVAVMTMHFNVNYYAALNAPGVAR